MTRLRDTSWRYDPSLPVRLSLIMGPGDGLTDEQLAAAWRVEGPQLMESCRDNPNPAWRCWAYWRFELGEPQPPDEVAEAVRLAELGELRPDEIANLRRRAGGSRRWARVWRAARQALAA